MHKLIQQMPVSLKIFAGASLFFGVVLASAVAHSSRHSFGSSGFRTAADGGEGGSRGQMLQSWRARQAQLQGQIADRGDWSEVAIHRINAFHDHEPAAALLPGQCNIQGHGIVMLKLFHSTPRKDSAIAQTEMGTIVENGNVGFSKQAGNRAERTAETTVEENGIFTP